MVGAHALGEVAHHGYGTLEIVLVDGGGLEDPHVLHGDGDLVAPHYGGGVLLAGSLSVRMHHGDLKMYHGSLMIHRGALSHVFVTNLTMMSGCQDW